MFGVDSYRYYFMREIQFGQDGSFSFEAMVERHNADLANGLGNLASRVLAMLASNFDGVGARRSRSTGAESDLPVGDRRRGRALPSPHGTRRTLPGARRRVGDRRAGQPLPRREGALEDQGPEKRDELASILYASAETLRILAVLIFPIMPRAASVLWSQLGIEEDLEEQRLPASRRVGRLAAGTKTTKGESLFPRLETE